jgi:hypothetical protein
MDPGDKHRDDDGDDLGCVIAYRPLMAEAARMATS